MEMHFIMSFWNEKDADELVEDIKALGHKAEVRVDKEFDVFEHEVWADKDIWEDVVTALIHVTYDE